MFLKPDLQENSTVQCWMNERENILCHDNDLQPQIHVGIVCNVIGALRMICSDWLVRIVVGVV